MSINTSAHSANKPQHQHTAKLAKMAGSLTSLALLPLGAQAGIVYHAGSIGPLNTSTNVINWDVDGNGTPEFHFVGNGSSLFMDSSGNNARGLVQAAGQSGDYFQNLIAGLNIGASLANGYQWGAAGQTARTMLSGSGTLIGFDAQFGGFTNGSGQYFGFRFTDNGTNLYNGWAELNFDTSAGTLTVTRWAYNNTSGGSILVGQTTSVPEAPLPTLMLLGMGLGGLRAFRNKKQTRKLNA